MCCQPTQLQCISVRACGKDGSLPQLPMNPPSDGGTHSDNANDAQLVIYTYIYIYIYIYIYVCVYIYIYIYIYI